MINWKSILSSFNDKPTLLEWLKLVEKALKESVLKSVTTEQDADKANTKLIFNFEDGTQIATDFFPTKGKDAAEITSATSMYMGTTNGLSKSRVSFSKSDNRSFYTDIMAKAGKAVESFSSAVKEVTDENTVNTITVNYDDKTSNTFDVISARGKQGETGAQGVSITRIEDVSNEIVGNQTLTTLRVYYSNGETGEISIYAENGETPTVSIDPFITGQHKLERGAGLSVKNNKVYFIQCFDANNNLAEFNINSTLKPLKGKLALIICGDNEQNLAIVQTGSIIVSDFVKTTINVYSVTPTNENNSIRYYEIDGAPIVRNQ